MIINQLYQGQVTPDLVNEWYHVVTGEELPVDATDFERFGNLYNINWLGLFVTALCFSKAFTAEHWVKDRSFFPGVLCFTREEGVKILTQEMALLGGSPAVNKNTQFLLESSRNGFTQLYGSLPHYPKSTSQDSAFSLVLLLIEKYCAVVSLPPSIPLQVSQSRHPVAVQTSAIEQATGWRRIVRLSLKAIWFVACKYFPWLGFLTVIIYTLIDYLMK